MLDTDTQVHLRLTPSPSLRRTLPRLRTIPAAQVPSSSELSGGVQEALPHANGELRLAPLQIGQLSTLLLLRRKNVRGELLIHPFQLNHHTSRCQDPIARNSLGNPRPHATAQLII
jgi:hypothetical protein